MPRKARIDAPGALHHIIVRGLERTKIFRYNYDRKNFLQRLSELIPETRTDCFAWTLIPNHVHLLLRTGSVPISVLMNRLLTGYAGWFNKRHKRHGQLFQNRYKSILCQEDLYFKELVRYIHLNPLRSEIVSDMNELDTYPWCGHSVIMGNNSQSWHNIDYVYGSFSDKKRLAVKRYRSFVKKGLSEGSRPDLSGGGLVRSAGGWTELKAIRKTDARIKGDERILGNSDFVVNVLNASNEKLEEKYVLKEGGYDFNYAVQRVSSVLNMAPNEVMSGDKSPRTVQARALLCFWVHRKLGLTTIEISEKIGVCQSAVSRLSRKGEKMAYETNVEFI